MLVSVWALPDGPWSKWTAPESYKLRFDIRLGNSSVCVCECAFIKWVHLIIYAALKELTVVDGRHFRATVLSTLYT